jgi:hypothetical protein
MRLVRNASVQEVLAASQWPDETRKLLSEFPCPRFYEFDEFDVGTVVVTVHLPSRNTDGPIREMFKNWQTWLTYPSPEARGDRRIHLRLVAVLKRGEAFSTFPIVDERPRYHDGRHRLFAFYDVATSEARELTLGVFRLERKSPPSSS